MAHVGTSTSKRGNSFSPRLHQELLNRFSMHNLTLLQELYWIYGSFIWLKFPHSLVLHVYDAQTHPSDDFFVGLAASSLLVWMHLLCWFSSFIFVGFTAFSSLGLGTAACCIQHTQHRFYSIKRFIEGILYWYRSRVFRDAYWYWIIAQLNFLFLYSPLFTPLLWWNRLWEETRWTSQSEFCKGYW